VRRIRRISFLEDVGIRPEIGGLEDQRIAFPMPARITQPLAKVLADVRRLSSGMMRALWIISGAMIT